jgi:hydroxymethylglutaryl-CoA synthase
VSTAKGFVKNPPMNFLVKKRHYDFLKKSFTTIKPNYVSSLNGPLTVGIDSLSLNTARYTIDMKELGTSRGIDPNKYIIGLGQNSFSVMPPNEDIVTLAAGAALPIINPKNPPTLILFATESGIDASKASGIWVHKLLGLPGNCRVVELKQACYSGTAAIQLALPYILANPKEEVLVIAADNARYGIKSAGEPTQGCGACAFIIKANPRLIAFEVGSGYHTQDVMDFWRPTPLSYALVDGKLSTNVYLDSLEKCWVDYHNKTKRNLDSHSKIIYHLPFSKMADKAHDKLTKMLGPSPFAEHSLKYSKYIGNTYSASLYFGLTSLLETDPEDLSGKRIGFFSYGSGCMAEFFSGIVQLGYQNSLRKKEHKHLIESRIPLTTSQYEEYFTEVGKQTLEHHKPTDCKTGPFKIHNIAGYIREYQKTHH